MRVGLKEKLCKISIGRHEVLTRRNGFMGTQTHLPPTFSFSSDFVHFILKMLKNAKKTAKKKDTETSAVLGGGTSPADFSTGETRSPFPPLSTPMCTRLLGLPQEPCFG